MRAYLDATVLLTIIIDEAAAPAADRFIDTWSGDLMVNYSAAAEVTSALSRIAHTRQITRDDAQDRLGDFDMWRAEATAQIDMNDSDMRLANAYVRRFELMLRAPDALHAAICRRNELTLVTLDRRLASAASQLGIAVHVPIVEAQ